MNPKAPLISVIVPVYNDETHIEKCVLSIQRQLYKNIEIIIIDDGSTDDSGRICDRVAKDDKRIHVYHTKNNGLVLARKNGLRYATGEYIAFVDSDDYIDEDMYTIMLEQLLEDDADFIHSLYIEENEKGSAIVGGLPKIVQYFEKNEDKIYFLKKYFFESESQEFITPSIWSKLFKAEFIKKCYSFVPNEQSYGEDIVCLVRCILEAKRISIIDKAYYHYLVRAGSMSHNPEKNFFEEIHLWHYMLEIIKEYHLAEANLYVFLKNKMQERLKILSNQRMYIQQFYWNNMTILRGKKLLLYGAGVVGKDYYNQISKYQDCEIVAWIDKNAENITCEYASIYSLQEISKFSYDYVLIAVKDKIKAEEMSEVLKTYGVSQNKIIWDKPEM